jgi:hypothetical protein
MSWFLIMTPWMSRAEVFDDATGRGVTELCLWRRTAAGLGSRGCGAGDGCERARTSRSRQVVMLVRRACGVSGRVAGYPQSGSSHVLSVSPLAALVVRHWARTRTMLEGTRGAPHTRARCSLHAPRYRPYGRPYRAYRVLPGLVLTCVTVYTSMVDVTSCNKRQETLSTRARAHSLQPAPREDIWTQKRAFLTPDDAMRHEHDVFLYFATVYRRTVASRLVL